ncbi:MAG: site-specific integrase [Candidatus Bathyarchaeia archaeon]|nr:site-specific integrase [Candidatus Bathyarchaeia archaeon]
MGIFEKNLIGGEKASRECPNCHSKKNWKAGVRQTQKREVQRFQCQDCGFRFSEKSNIESNTNRGRQLCVLNEAKKLGTTTETKTVAGEEKQTIKGKLVQFAFYCKKEGMTDATIKTFNSAMKRLSKSADISDPESVKEAIAEMKVKENTKVSYCVAYTVFLKFQGKTWKPPRYRYRQKLPEFLPTEEEINSLIAGCGPKTGTILQLIKETGMRIGECLTLKWMCVNFEKRIITLTDAEKHSLPRIFRVSKTLINMMANLPKMNDAVFGVTTRVTAESCLRQSRQKVARKLGKPRIAKIHFHLLRHWFGTMEYHKTRDMDHVRRLLGHKSILNTQMYVNMEKVFFPESSEDYVVKVASNVEEACKLLEVGFEYVTELDGKKLFRKRK